VSIYITNGKKFRHAAIDDDAQLILDTLNSSPFVSVDDVINACDGRWKRNQVTGYVNRRLEKIGLTGCAATMDFYHDLIKQGKKRIECAHLCNDHFGIDYAHKTYDKQYRSWLSSDKTIKFTTLIVSAWTTEGLRSMAA